MHPTRNIKLRWLHGTLRDVTVTRVHFLPAQTHVWQPAINAFRCERGVRICVDLAGVEKSSIELTVEPQRIVMRGTREAPEPTSEESLQMLAFEIDYGPFEREVHLPVEVDVEQAHAEQENGLLWITLPAKR
jgi:HSP20 family protein